MTEERGDGSSAASTVKMDDIARRATIVVVVHTTALITAAFDRMGAIWGSTGGSDTEVVCVRM